MDELETERLRLRHFKRDDLQDLYEYASVPGVGEWAGWVHHASLHESQAVLDFMFIPDKNTFAIELKSEKKVIGSIAAKTGSKTANDFPDKRVLELGYVLSPSYQHHGYMTQAVRALTEEIFDNDYADVITICHYKGNVRSENVMIRAGYSYYKTVKDVYVASLHQRTSSLCFYLTSDQYASLKGKRNEKK